MPNKSPVSLPPEFDRVDSLGGPASALDIFHMQRDDGFQSSVTLFLLGHEGRDRGSEILAMGGGITVVAGVDQHDSDHSVFRMDLDFFGAQVRHARNLVSELRVLLRR